MLEDIPAGVPGLQLLCEGRDTSAVFVVVVVVVVVVIVICVHILNDLDGIQVSGIFCRTRRVGVETESDTALGEGLHIVVKGVSFGGGHVRLGTPTGPSLAIGLHETVLVIGPDAHALVLECLFHPLMVVRLLE